MPGKQDKTKYQPMPSTPLNLEEALTVHKKSKHKNKSKCIIKRVKSLKEKYEKNEF